MATLQELEEELNYNPDTGQIFWTRQSRGRRRGKEAGYIWKVKREAISGKAPVQRYRVIALNKEILKAHNIAWLLVHGEMPDGYIVDHRDGDGLNNRLLNLRLIPKEENAKNRATAVNNKSGVTGVSFNRKTGKWQATIQTGGKKEFLGGFEQKADAIAARREAEKRLGFYRRHGRIVQPDRERLKFFHME